MITYYWSNIFMQNFGSLNLVVNNLAVILDEMFKFGIILQLLKSSIFRCKSWFDWSSFEKLGPLKMKIVHVRDWVGMRLWNTVFFLDQLMQTLHWASDGNEWEIWKSDPRKSWSSSNINRLLHHYIFNLS